MVRSIDTHPAAELVAILGLDDQMDVVVLDAHVHDPKVPPLQANRDGPVQRLVEMPPP
jgi:hypothetical protein|nr:hypothetical protein [Kofleriaceae bacterium]